MNKLVLCENQVCQYVAPVSPTDSIVKPADMREISNEIFIFLRQGLFTGGVAEELSTYAIPDSAPKRWKTRRGRKRKASALPALDSIASIKVALYASSPLGSREIPFHRRRA